MSALIDLCLRELFEFRLMQTDPNFANYRWRPETGQIVLLDFGATREIGAEVAAGHLELLRAGLARDRDRRASRLWRRSASSGPAWLSGIAWRFSTWRLWGSGRSTARSISRRTTCRTGCAKAGMEIGSERELWHIPPAETLFLQRKIGGLYLLAARLGATVDFPNLLARWA
jgi:hypothetical protein